jgi:hypothetical protein
VRNSKLPLTFLPLCFLTLACTPTTLQKPTARFQSANVRDVSAQGFRVDFDVALTNPNSFSVPLTAADYKLALGGQDVTTTPSSPRNPSRPTARRK